MYLLHFIILSSKCYLEIVERKFKSSLVLCRKSKRESITHLIAVSSGPSSRAMVHLFAQSCSGEARKKVLMSAILVCVDEGDSAQDNLDMKFLEKLSQQYNYPAYVASLDSSLLKVEDWKPNTNSNTKGGSLLDLCNTGTSKHDMLAQRREDILQRAAVKLGCTSILLGTSANRAATLLISNTCLGRGFTALAEHKIPFYQPMRDFLLKEIVMYNRNLGLEWEFVPNLATKQAPKNSIHQLTEAFINGLQSEYPHTIHTLLKSGDKLTAPSSTSYSSSCSVCGSVISAIPTYFINEPDDRPFCYGCKRMLRECNTDIITLLHADGYIEEGKTTNK